MIDKEKNLFDECAARCVHLFPQDEEWQQNVYTHVSISIANSQRIQTEINKSDTIAKIRI